VAEGDFLLYLTYLRNAAARTGCAIHAYVLMTNHVHLLLTPRDALAVSCLMQHLGRRYVRKFNERHGRTGTLWEGRFRSSVIDSERYFLVCQRYIEQNPVRAGLVREARDYPWSSHRHYIDGLENPLLTEHECFLRMGQTASERRGAYRVLCSENVDDEIVDYLRAAIHRGQSLGRRRHVPGTRAAGHSVL
jgi:putative transposase